MYFFYAIVFHMQWTMLFKTENTAGECEENTHSVLYRGGGFCIEICLLAMKGGVHISQIAKRLFNLLIGTSMWNYPLWFLVAFFVCKCLFDWIMKIAYRGSKMPKTQSHKKILFLCAVGAICFVLGLYLASIRKEFFYPFRADIGITMVPFMLAGFF